MLRKIKKYVRQVESHRQNKFDPLQFNDQIASITDWRPMSVASANFNTYQLYSPRPEVLQFKITLQARIFFGLFMLFGGGFVIGILFSTSLNSIATLIPFGICVILFSAGAAMWYFMASPKYFHRNNQYFVKGRGKKVRKIRFSEMYALQLLPSYVTSTDGPGYYNYQINLVLKNAERINVCYYSSVEKARKDMQTISQFTGKKSWDATLN